MLRALAERQGLLTSWYTHMALQDRRLVKVSVMVQAKVRLIIDAVQFGRSWLLGTWLIGQMSCLFSTDSKVSLALLANWCERLYRVWDSDFGRDFVNQTHLILVEYAICMRYIVV